MLSTNLISKKIEKKTFFNKEFKNYNFWNAKLNNVKFKNCVFKNCIFSDCVFKNILFEKCNFINCNFQHASIINSIFKINKSENNLLDDLKIQGNNKISKNFFKINSFKIESKKTSFLKTEKDIYYALTSGPGYIILKKYYKKNLISKAFKIIDKIVKEDKKIEKYSKIFERNKRFNQKWIRSPLNLNPLFTEFLLPKIVDRVFKKMLGADYICGSYAINCLLPGARGQKLHIDYPYYNFTSPGKYVPFKKFNLNLQVLTPLTNFSKDNGATVIVENSHKKLKFPDLKDLKNAKIKFIKLEPGSILIYNGLLWHGASHNFSEKSKRYGLIAQYIPSYIVPMENLKKMTSKKIINNNKLIQKLLGVNSKYPILSK
jgi:uncharacterized protein YjbI with pentapeptide repeats